VQLQARELQGGYVDTPKPGNGESSSGRLQTGRQELPESLVPAMVRPGPPRLGPLIPKGVLEYTGRRVSHPPSCAPVCSL
jgi:hypothetical protein